MAHDAASGAAPGRRPRDDKRTGARAAGGEGKKKKGGLLWLLLGLLALLLIAALLLWLLGVFDSADKADSSGSSANSGTLKVANKALLPVPAAGLASFAGKKASGKQLEVVKVNGNQGFSVGKGGSDPVYVEWGGDVGSNEASKFHPKKGEKVNLTGPVERAGAPEIKKLKLKAADAKLVKAQKAFVNADQVKLSK